MFSKTKATPTAGTSAPAPARKPSVVSGDMRIIGDVISEGEVRIEGRVEGNIKSQSVIVTEAAEVRGNVDAEELTLQGALVGSVRAKIVRLMASSLMMGDVAHEVLKVEAGAKVEGRYRPARYNQEIPQPRPTVTPERPPKGTRQVAAKAGIKGGSAKTPEPALEDSGTPALQ